jgi:hypothetical protein
VNLLTSVRRDLSYSWECDRAAGYGNAEPAEACARPRPGIVSYQASAFGRHLRGIVMGFERRERTDGLKQQVLKLEERLRSRRVVPAAILQVMHSHTVAEPAAFALIRRAAMEQRKTIEQMSAEIAAKGTCPATG